MKRIVGRLGDAWSRLLVCGSVLLGMPCLMPSVTPAAEPIDLRVRLRPEVVSAGKSSAAWADAIARASGARVRVHASFPALEPGRGVQPSPAAAAALERLRAWYVLEVEDAGAVPAIEARLRSSGLVASVEPALLHETMVFPDDEHLSSQPYLGVARVYQAYDVVRASDAGVLVAVVDGGTDWNHQDLRDNVWDRPGEIEGNGRDDDGNGYVDDVHGWSFATSTPDPTGFEATPSNAAHGTHIAGIISAVSDNGVGVAGVSWNARLLLVNAGDPERDGGIRYGFEGLLYAALSGADIVNASWGRTGRYSQFEADVVEAVQALGTLIVAAAGNAIDGAAFYPAFYSGVLSVARSGIDELANPLSNADHWIDVAAPGSLIWNTLPGDGYGFRGGTSQSAAVVSGVAALVKARHPEWTAESVREQIRWSTRPLRELPEELRYRFGTGLIDAEAAVGATQIGLHVLDLALKDQDADGLVEPGETITFQLELRNDLGTLNDVRVRLVVPEEDVVLLQDSIQLSVVAGGSDLSIVRGLTGWVPYTTPLGQLSPVVVVLETEGRSVHQAFYPELLPLYATLRTSRLEVSFTANGKLGFSQVTRPRDPGGVGVHRPGGPSTMLGGSFLVGDGPDRVSDAVISARPQEAFEDFFPIRDEIELLEGDGPIAQEYSSTYSDRSGSGSLDLRVSQRNLVFRDEERADFALSIYDVKAMTVDLLGLSVGVLVDWEMSRTHPDADEIGFDARENLLYGRDTADDDAELAGVAIVEAPGEVRASWLYDLPGEDASVPVLYDTADLDRPLPDEDLWSLLTDGRLSRQGSVVGGVAGVVGAGPFDLTQGESARMVLAYVMGRDLADLRRQAESARIAYESLREGFPEGPASRPKLLGPVPNPFNPVTEVRFSLPRDAWVRLDVYDSRGRHVVRLLEGSRRAGFHRIPWNGEDGNGRGVGSGVYHVRLVTDEGGDRTSLTLVR